MPFSVYNILQNKYSRGELVRDLTKFEKIIIYNLRKMSIEQISNLPDVSEWLEIMLVKSKRYTHSRISRILLYSLLGITKSDIDIANKLKTPYVRVLGFNENGRKLLSEISRINSKLPIVTSVKRFIDTNSNQTIKRMLDIDIFATDTYTLAYEYNSKSNLDFTKNLVKI